MTGSLRRLLAVALITLFALPPAALAAPAATSPTTAEVRGVLLNMDGTPAAGYQLGLRSKSGDLFLSAPAGADGAFAIEGLPPDSYRVVAFSPNGSEFPVLGREVELKAGQVERIEAKLGVKVIAPGSAEGKAAATTTKTASAGAKGKGFAGFWATTTGKVVIIVGGLFAVGAAASALSGNDDNNNDNNPSPSVP